MAKVLVLPVGSIEENPQALRTVVDKESLAYCELKDGIKSIGLLNPISVREYQKDDGSNGFRLVDGLHRLTACQDLGHHEIPVNVVTVDDSNLLVAQIIGNNNIKTTKSQFAQGMKQLIQHKGHTVKEVARLVCRNEKWVKDQLGLLNLPPSIQKLVDEEKVCTANALSLCKLPKDKLEDYIQAAMTETPDTFGPKIEEAVKELRTAAREGRKPVTEFRPTARPRKTTELKSILAEAESTGSASEIRMLLETQGIDDPVQAAIAALNWVMHLDPVSVAAERAKWDAEQATKEAAKVKREAEKTAKKQADAATAVENMVAA